MKRLLKNAWIFTRQGFEKRDVLIRDSKLYTEFSADDLTNSEMISTVDLDGLILVPGFADVHVHLREPGFSYKETIRTGSEAAAHGGYTVVLAMPNLKPVPSDPVSLQEELSIIRRDSVIHVLPYGSITKNRSGRGELADLAGLSPEVCGYSDDGTGVQDEKVMHSAMKEAARLGRVIAAHCEDERELKPGGCIHEGEYARIHHHVGINNASEWKEVERDIRLAEETGCQFHVCHVSTKESVDLIRRGKACGIRVTAETAPHYLMFTDMDLEEDGRWKMNPPIRSREDRASLLAAVKDGTIDCLITDHAPHSAEEKSRGLDHSLFGIVGLETCFAAAFHNLVLRDPEKASVRVDRAPELISAEQALRSCLAESRPNSDGASHVSPFQAGPASGGALSLYRLLEMLVVRPRQIFHLPGPCWIENGVDADVTILDLRRRWTVDSADFYSMGRSTLFDGMEVQGQVVETIVGGRTVYKAGQGILKGAEPENLKSFGLNKNERS